jgi:hypothetical protein
MVPVVQTSAVLEQLPPAKPNGSLLLRAMGVLLPADEAVIVDAHYEEAIARAERLNGIRLPTEVEPAMPRSSGRCSAHV